MADSEAPSTKLPRERQPLGLTLVLLVEVAVFAAALVWFTIILSQDNAVAALHGTEVSVATRQPTLVQRISTDLARMEVTPSDAVRDRSAAADALSAFSTLTATERAFEIGGPTTDLADKTIDIPRLTVASERQTLDQIDRQLTDVRSQIAPLDPKSMPANVPSVARQAAESMAGLGDLTTGLAAQVATGPVVSANSSLRDWLLRIAIVMVLFMVATLYERVSRGRNQIASYAGDLARKREEAETSARELAEAKVSSDLIMDTVDRGLLLIRPDYRIDGQYSRELEKIFRTPNLEGANFLNILQNLLTERVFEISRDYVSLLFDKKKKERTVLRVNPLSEVEVHFANPEGGFDSKFLNFSFRRIVEDGTVSRVFVAVSDITERVRLERELRESEARKERQFEFLLGVLHVDQGSLDDFLATAHQQISSMNDALRASDFAAASGSRMDLLRQRLDVVYRAVHTIKGNASMLQLSYFQKTCDAFEAKIVSLRERRALSGDDFLAIVIAQSELRQDIEELQDLRERFVGSGRFETASESYATPRTNASTPPPADIASNISALANSVAERFGKRVRVDATAFSDQGLPEETRRAIKDVLIQLTRNAVSHGVETPHEREVLGKEPVATLTMRSHATPTAFGFTFRDDGRGLDPTFIREKAVERKLASPKAAAAMSDQQLIGLIFRSGFSTVDESSTDAGRGVGMNVIKDVVVDRLGGRLTLNSDPGKFTEFGFTIPLDRESAAGERSAELAFS